jgi:hypothetical protein
MRSLTASDQGSPLIAFHVSAASRAVVIGLRSQPCAASSRARRRSFACASASFAPRVANALLRSPVVARLTSSISAGRLACASPLIARSTGW